MSFRTFLALDLEAKTRRKLAASAADLSACGARIRTVAPDNLHVTLNFLGDVDDDQLAEICNVAADVAAGVKAFDFAIHGISCIPPHGSVRMIWAGVDDPSGRLVELQQGLTAALEELGFPPDRRGFNPHLTLARVKGSAGELRAAAEAQRDEYFGSQHADEVVTYVSRLTPGGPIYTPAGRGPLGIGA